MSNYSDHGGEETSVPVRNTVVKLSSAENTAESLPGKIGRRQEFLKGASFLLRKPVPFLHRALRDHSLTFLKSNVRSRTTSHCRRPPKGTGDSRNSAANEGT